MQDKVTQKRKSNRLIHEKSPYLLQHAFNPVDWYPWDKEAFRVAKEEDKPVFVSIGYSSCHWCHVMEKESFDDEEVAKLMNKTFICIKVDREERPDLDNAYMKICQIMGRNCGWPLNVIMTPNKNPFFISSYIPKKNRFGIIGMIDLIPQIGKIWQSRKSELERLGEELKLRVESLNLNESEIDLGSDILDDAYEKLFLNFDRENGGFGQAPKFPTPHNLLFLLRYWKRTKNKNALMITKKTLQAMRLGGIFDQVGFGFHRYSTDSHWLVPHFEKMLYDQALLALVYAEAFQATNERKFEITTKEVLEYVLRELTSPEGGFYTAEDADSEGVEGKFYLWDKDEIRKGLPIKLQKIALSLFNVESKGNYPEAIQKENGRNILHIQKPLSEVASEFKISLNELIIGLGRIQKLLFKERKDRIHPFKDTKILVDWNGLMIAAFSKAGRIFNEPEYLKAAIKAGDFIWSKLKRKDGLLYHRFSGEEVAVKGFLDDYVFLAWGFLEIYEACFESKYLTRIEELIAISKKEFWDKNKGGFYFTSKDIEKALPRIKKLYDGAIPSGNSVALLTLLRLARLTEDQNYEILAKQMLKIFSQEIRTAPLAHTFLLSGLDFKIGPSFRVTLVGNPKDNNLKKMVKALNTNYLPNTIVELKLPNENKKKYKMLNDKATAFICSDKSCKPPTDRIDKMLKLLESERNKKSIN
ncbi:MAG: thioredoxin domain-containing protein [Candidatus Bathyarchaeota archaeon]|nr:thioredoxin domain-containing protein [Candidatus Bathyarchaeota archaeon]